MTLKKKIEIAAILCSIGICSFGQNVFAGEFLRLPAQTNAKVEQVVQMQRSHGALRWKWKAWQKFPAGSLHAGLWGFISLYRILPFHGTIYVGIHAGAVPREKIFKVTNCSVTGSIDGAVTPGTVAGRAVGTQN